MFVLSGVCDATFCSCFLSGLIIVNLLHLPPSWVVGWLAGWFAVCWFGCCLYWLIVTCHHVGQSRFLSFVVFHSVIFTLSACPVTRFLWCFLLETLLVLTLILCFCYFCYWVYLGLWQRLPLRVLESQTVCLLLVACPLSTFVNYC